MSRQFTQEDVRANADYFAAKLRAERSISDVADWARGEGGPAEFLVLDVRSRDAFAKGHVRGALSVPLARLEALTNALPKDRKYVTYCGSESCPLSAEAALQLAERGYFAQKMNAGWSEWLKAGHPTHAGTVPDGKLSCECSEGWATEESDAPRAEANETAPQDPAPAEAEATQASEPATEAEAAPAAEAAPEQAAETEPAEAAAGAGPAESAVEDAPPEATAEPTGEPASAKPGSKAAAAPTKSGRAEAPSYGPGKSGGPKGPPSAPVEASPVERLSRLAARDRGAAPISPAPPSRAPAAGASRAAPPPAPSSKPAPQPTEGAGPSPDPRASRA